MTTFLWIAAFVCWGIAALLVAGIVYPHFFRPGRWERHGEMS
jgi:hypothetical protein